MEKVISLPLLETAQPSQKLIARWEIVDGKLTCKWYRTPD